MARKKVEKTIVFSEGDERRFEIQQFKVKDGHAVLERLLRVSAPILGVLAENLGAEGEDALVGDLSKEGVSQGFEKFAEHLVRNEGILDWLTEKVRKNVRFETEEEGQFVTLTSEIYEDLFAGEYGAEVELVLEALKLNYATFFGKAGGLGAVARRFVTPKRSRSSSPKASTSGSGASS